MGLGSLPPEVRQPVGIQIIDGSIKQEISTKAYTLGIEDVNHNLSFNIYPNPSKGVFNIEFTPANQDKIQINLYDLRGRLINQVEYDDVSTNGMFKQQLDYSYLNSGMYFLVVKNGDKSATKKLIKE